MVNLKLANTSDNFEYKVLMAVWQHKMKTEDKGRIVRNSPKYTEEFTIHNQ